MDERLERKALRGRFSSLGWALLIYLGLMNVSVGLVSVFDVVCRAVSRGIDGFMQGLGDSLLNNGWGYVLAVAIGLLLLRLWKGREFCYQEIWIRGAPMRVEDFLPILCIFISCQLLFQLMAAVQEFFLNKFGLSALYAVEMATGMGDTFSMFLYMGVIAPIAEELLFRGLMLRTLLPYGKRFAILLSAFLFGIFHGNVVQTPYAFCVGLVLGYVAAEHSILWAMVLHMFNNLILGDVMTRLTSGLPGPVGDVILWAVIVAFSVGALLAAAFYRKEIAAYIRANKVEDKTVSCFFTAPGILVLTAFMLLNIATTILLQLI